MLWAGALVRKISGPVYCAIPRDYLSDSPLLRANPQIPHAHKNKIGTSTPPPF